jgi:hypothetical protein
LVAFVLLITVWHAFAGLVTVVVGGAVVVCFVLGAVLIWIGLGDRAAQPAESAADAPPSS